MNRPQLDTSFAVLPSSLAPADALARLGDRTYAVLVDEAGRVIALGTATELLEGADLPPAVEIPAGLPLDKVLDGEAVTLLDLNRHGAVVVEARTVVGVVPAEVIDEEVATGKHVGSRTMGDAQLPGEVRVPVARVVCLWRGCGFVNEITFYDPDRPQDCGNPELPAHAIVVTRS